MDGFDVHFGDDERMREYIKLTLAMLYKQYSYIKISIPLLEKQTVFSSEIVGSHPWPSWHPKSLFPITIRNYNSSYEEDPFINFNCFLIPEATATVCRWVASKVKDKSFLLNNGFQLRTFYIVNSFRNELINKISDTKYRQFTQIGIENFGDDSYKSDIEILYMAYKSLKVFGFANKDIRIRISDVRIFNEFCKVHKLGLHQQYILKDLIDKISNQKSNGNKEELFLLIKMLKDRARDFNINNKEFPIDIFYSDYHESQKLLKDIKNYPVEITTRLKDILRVANEIGINLTVDYSVIRSQEYYSGLTFQIDLLLGKHTISEVGGGGRYDYFVKRIMELENIWHKGFPSIGFAFSLERITKAAKIKKVQIPSVINYPLNYSESQIIVSSDIGRLINHSKGTIRHGRCVSLYYRNINNHKLDKLAQYLHSKVKKI